MTTDTIDSKPTLFERLGGTEAVRAVVQEFYTRLLADDGLAFFFEGVTLTALKIHQFEFLKLAFTGVPDGVDVGALMLQKHERLFRSKGLNVNHFDMVANHLVATLQHFKVAPELIEEAAGVVLPLRPIFEKGAEMYGTTEGERKEGEEKEDYRPLATTTLLEKLGGSDAVAAAVQEMYKRLLEDPETSPFFEDINMAWLKQHQIDFMKIAFTQIPEDLDVPNFVKVAHSALFEKKGLTEKHFDLVAKHFVGALTHLSVDQALIDEAVTVVGSLRPVFEQGAQEAREKELNM
jgi:hemoglobin